MFTHSARAKRAQNLVMANSRAGLRRGHLARSFTRCAGASRFRNWKAV